jgi:hypothetical protein
VQHARDSLDERDIHPTSTIQGNAEETFQKLGEESRSTSQKMISTAFFLASLISLHPLK